MSQRAKGRFTTLVDTQVSPGFLAVSPHLPVTQSRSMAPPFGLIKKLQKQTGKSFGACKQALTAYDNDLDAAAASLDPASAAPPAAAPQPAGEAAATATSVNPAAATESKPAPDSTRSNVRESAHTIAHDAIARDRATISSQQIHDLHPALEDDLAKLEESHVKPEPAPAENVTLGRHQLFPDRIRSWDVDDGDLKDGEALSGNFRMSAVSQFRMTGVKIFPSVINADVTNVDRAIKYEPECIHERTEKVHTVWFYTQTEGCCGVGSNSSSRCC